ncbi:hypothetical protein ACI2OX_01655 [Bacillus sp. N9]
MNKVVSISSIVDTELDWLQEELLAFVETKDPQEVATVLRNLIGNVTTEEEMEHLSILLIKWMIFHYPYNSGILADEFIERKKRKNKLRPATLAQIEKWRAIAPSCSIVTNIIDEEWLEVKDCFTGEVKKVKVYENAPDFEEGMYLLGFYFHMVAIILIFCSHLISKKRMERF